MFFLVDFDDISGGIGAFIKIFIIIGILAIPLGFLKWNDDSLTIGTLVFALCVAGFITNILTIASGFKKVRKEKLERNNKLTKNLIIITICFIVTSIIGYIMTFKIWNITLKGFASMAAFSFLFNIAFSLLLQNKFNERKMKFGDYIKFILEFLKYKVIGQQLLIGAVVLFLLSLICNLGLEDNDFKGSGLNKFASNLVNYITTNVVYYDNKYENVREGKTAKEIVQEEIRHIMNDLATDDKEIDKLTSYHIGTNRTAYETVRKFTTSYITNKKIMKPFVDKYGISIGLTHISDDEKYDNLFVITLYDYSVGKTLYYKFDIDTGEIGEQFKNKEEAEKYTNNIINLVRKEK